MVAIFFSRLPGSPPVPIDSIPPCDGSSRPILSPQAAKTRLPFSPAPSPPLLPYPRRPFRHLLPYTRRGARRFSKRLFSSRAVSPTPIDLDSSSVGGERGVQVEDDDEEEGTEVFDWRAHWYPVAPVCDLDKRAPHAKRVMGLDVVVWWDRAEERWQVFDDSCPHRLAPLSEGRIDQWGRLQCVYHGWCFDGSGSCKYIPQAPADGPPVHTFKQACATVYPNLEQNKILWFWPNSDPQFKDVAMRKKPPYLPVLDDPTYSCLMMMRDFPYGYEILIENLMDPAHVPYAHYGVARTPRAKSTSADREGGRPIDITVQEFSISGFTAKQELGYNKFLAPCLFYAAPHSGSSHETDLKVAEVEISSNPQAKARRTILVFICIPVSPGKSRLIWVFPRNFAVWLDRIVPRWMFHVGQNLVLDSDLYLLHLEEHKIAEFGMSNWQKACFVPTTADALVVAFRKWLKMYSKNQVNWGSKFKPQLPPTPPREQVMDRYWSHCVQCSSCRKALKGLQVLEVLFQIASVTLIGVLAAMKLPTVISSVMVSMAVLFMLLSRWLSHFIHKNFYYHDFDHAFK